MSVSRLTLLALFALSLDVSQTVAQTDLYGDPLPKGAIARMGTARFRHTWMKDYVLLPDDRTVVTAGGDRLLRFWDLATAKQQKIVPLEGQGAPGKLLTLSPDGKMAVTKIGKQLIFWDAASGKELRRLPDVGVAYLRFAPDSKTLAVGRGTLQIDLIDVRTGAVHALMGVAEPNPQGFVVGGGMYHGNFSHDGKWFIAALGQPALAVFDTATRRLLHEVKLNGILTSVVAPDSKKLAVCAMEYRNPAKPNLAIVLFDLASGKETARFAVDVQLRNSPELAYAPDGKMLACGSWDEGCLLDLATGKVRYRIGDRPGKPRFSRDGKTLLFSTGQRLRTLDAVTGKEHADRPGLFRLPLVVALSPDGRLLASGNPWDSTVSLWDTSSGRLVRQPSLAADGDYIHLTALAFSADGKTLFGAQASGLLQAWDTTTGKAQRMLRLQANADAPGGGYVAIHVSPDDRHASALERGQRLARWETATGKRVGPGYVLPTYAQRAAWLAGGRLAIVPGRDALTMIDVARGTVAVRFASDADNDQLVLSPDGRLLAGKKKRAAKAKGDPGAVVWETATGQEVATVTTDSLSHWALAPDNRCLVTCEAGVLMVRDLATGKVRQRWPLPEAELRVPNRTYLFTLLLTPDGKRAITVMADGTALVWDIGAAGHAGAPLVRDAGKAELAGWWADLAAPDAAKARRAIWSLVDLPAAAVPFLAGRLKPVAAPDAKQVARWIADLDSDDFATRQAAQDALAEIADRIRPTVDAALKGKVSLETRRRLERLAREDFGVPAAEDLRGLRAVEALELMGTTDARTLLRSLAAGAAGARLTAAAQAALERIGRRDLLLRSKVN